MKTQYFQYFLILLPKNKFSISKPFVNTPNSWDENAKKRQIRTFCVIAFKNKMFNVTNLNDSFNPTITYQKQSIHIRHSV